MKCPNCKKEINPTIIKEYNGLDNIDNLFHSHVRCCDCEYEFNLWDVDKNRLKQAFGPELIELYL